MGALSKVKKKPLRRSKWLFEAPCRIRTNDPEITNHVLWPAELRRHKLSCSLSTATQLIYRNYQSSASTFDENFGYLFFEIKTGGFDV